MKKLVFTTAVAGIALVAASAWVENPRVYLVKDGILQPGTNFITVLHRQPARVHASLEHSHESCSVFCTRRTWVLQ